MKEIFRALRVTSVTSVSKKLQLISDLLLKRVLDTEVTEVTRSARRLTSIAHSPFTIHHSLSFQLYQEDITLKISSSLSPAIALSLVWRNESFDQNLHTPSLSFQFHLSLLL